MIAYLPHERIETIIQNLDSTETSHVNKLGLEYKASSADPKEFALMFNDERQWVKSSYLNEELDSGSFFDVRPHLKK